MKRILALLTLIAFTSCAYASGKHKPQPKPEPPKQEQSPVIQTRDKGTHRFVKFLVVGGAAYGIYRLARYCEKNVCLGVQPVASDTTVAPGVGVSIALK